MAAARVRKQRELALIRAPGRRSLYKAEREFLDRKTLIPLLYLSRSYGVSGRVRDLRLDAAGMPDLANASLEDAQ